MRKTTVLRMILIYHICWKMEREFLVILWQVPETVKGKLVYGCLEKSKKAQVDDIVDELENLPVVADCKLEMF